MKAQTVWVTWLTFFQIMAGLLSGMTTATVVVGIYIHLHKRRKLALYDFLVLFAIACLAVENGLLYHNFDMIFIYNNKSFTSQARSPANHLHILAQYRWYSSLNST
jgi:hypothetical protein